MLESLSQLPEIVTSVAVVLAVVSLDLLLSIPRKNHPMTLLRITFCRLSEKVQPDINRQPKQQIIAGLLTLLAATLPWSLLALLFTQFTEYPIFFEAVILWFCLGLMPCLKDIKKAEHALKKQQKLLARDRIDDWLLRKTERLSEVGIAKAAIESLLLRNSYFYQSILLTFIVFGPYAALTLRLLLELNQVCNRKLKRYQHFSLSIAWLTKVILWLPSKLSALLYLVGGKITLVKAGLTQPQFGLSSNAKWQLACASASLKVRLGGPVFYDDDKIQRPHFATDYPQPDANSIQAARQLVTNSNLSLLAILILVASFAVMAS